MCSTNQPPAATRARPRRTQGAKWIRREKRLGIYLRDGLACAWCGEGMEDGAVLTLDHLTPYCRGGSNKETNLVTSCRRCNSSRGDRAVADFAAAVAHYLGEDIAEEINAHVADCAARELKPHVASAKALIAARGSYSAALKAAK